MSLSSLAETLFPFLAPGSGDEAGDAQEATATRRRPVTRADVARLYERPPSFTDLLPWMEYLPETQCFLLEDGVSVGALFELTPVGVEARTPQYLDTVYNGLQSALADSIPEDDASPWIVQVYVQDEPSLRRYLHRIEDYAQPQARDTEFTRAYLDLYAEHLARIARPGGLFEDTAVTGGRWQGKYRRVRVVLYRRVPPSKTPNYRDPAPEEAIGEIGARLETALASAGVRLRRCDGREFYDWMLAWFNPASPLAGSEPGRITEVMPYPGDDAMPFGPDFAETLTLSMPRSDNATGTWWFDGLPHTVVTIQNLRRKPLIGHFTAARTQGKHIYALFDTLPEHTVMAMTIVIKRQDQVRNHVQQVHDASVGDAAEAELARTESHEVLREMAKGDKLFPCAIAFYVRGRDRKDLRARVNRIDSVLAPQGLQPIVEEADLLRLDAYLRNLPMSYDLALDRVSRRARLLFASDIAALLPAFGRSRGTRSPGLKFFNRGGEPLVFDPLSRADRKMNGHLLLLGPTGSGKSAQLVDLLLQEIAVHRPRVFIIEAGQSHTLLGRYLKTLGLSVNQVALSPKADVSLPPFSDALRLLEADPSHGPELGAAYTDEELSKALHEDEEDLETRDILGEMEIAARIMITGGDDREDARLTRADRLLIRNAIYGAARRARDRGADQVLVEDVAGALRAIGRGEYDADLPEHRRLRAADMADSMDLFCSGVAGHFFNRPGTPWPEADVTILDLGLLAREGYRDQLILAYVSLMNRINDLVERHQHDPRPTIVATDEGHIITTDGQLAAYVVKITKMWRKFGAWFWIATQNLEDFPDQARKMLNMIEWWLCLSLPKEEVEQIARFKDLNDEQRSLLLSAHKEPGKYVEGVVISPRLEVLFRAVPPALALALAMTEKEEKAERAQIMRERGCTELEAAYAVAERIEARRG